MLRTVSELYPPLDEPLQPPRICGFICANLFLDNTFPASVKLDDGIEYPSADHAYVAQKTNDLDIRRHIADLPDTRSVKHYAAVSGLRRDWGSYKLHAMLLAVRAKFQQNPHLQYLLLATGDSYLEHTNTWGETYWGASNGEGQNNLGKVLMQVRWELRQSLQFDDAAVQLDLPW